MGCFNPIPTYANPPFAGIKIASSVGDGYNVNIEWYQAYSERLDYNVVYNIYYSSNPENVFDEGIKFVVTNPVQTTVNVPDLTPGDVYYFAVRGTSFPINDVNLVQLPVVNGLSVYPEGMLLQDISDTDTVIPIMDADTFPSFGLIQAGAEIIGYSSVDIPNSSLISSASQRGMFGTFPREHQTDGYDGYVMRSPIVTHYKGFEECNKSYMLQENQFSPYKYAYTADDGYKDKEDIVYPDVEIPDCLNEDFKRWDYSGYRRTRPADYIGGRCVGTYFGGEYYCADGYASVSGPIRGLGFDEHQNQREEILLETYGQPMTLIRRQTSGKTSMHYDNKKENTIYRGLDTYGTDLVTGYEQFHNPRRSDGRILVRFDPTKEDIKREEMGLENEFMPNAWTLSYPTLKDGDVLIGYNRDGSPEFRYEIINVTRNRTFLNNDGRQIFTAVRVRKTDPINQFKVIHDSSKIPETLTTSVGMVAGAIPPHVHEIVINEGVISLNQINQTTSLAQGHNHPIENGVVCEILGHTHDIVLP